jgi:hypothetical protein
VWHDGQLARKSAADQHRMAVEVCGPMPGAASAAHRAHWRDDSRLWRKTASEWIFAERHGLAAGIGDSPNENGPVYWLTYQHDATTIAGKSSDRGEILDDSAYDQSESRRLHPVRDVMVRGTIAISRGSTVLFRLSSDDDAFIARLGLRSGEVQLSHNGRVVRTSNDAGIGFDDRSAFEWGSVDQQVRLSVKGRTVLEYAYEPAVCESSGGPTLAIGGQRGTVTVTDLRVLRDVYYIEAPHGGETQLAAGEYFLLGDNSAHSRDSRHWPSHGAVPAAWIVGRAIRW